MAETLLKIYLEEKYKFEPQRPVYVEHRYKNLDCFIIFTIDGVREVCVVNIWDMMAFVNDRNNL